MLFPSFMAIRIRQFEHIPNILLLTSLFKRFLCQAYPIFKDAFMNDARVSHMVQVMGFHPKYTVHWVQTHHDLLRGNGPLPREYRAYIGIMVRDHSYFCMGCNYLKVI